MGTKSLFGISIVKCGTNYPLSVHRQLSGHLFPFRGRRRDPQSPSKSTKGQHRPSPIRLLVRLHGGLSPRGIFNFPGSTSEGRSELNPPKQPIVDLVWLGKGESKCQSLIKTHKGKIKFLPLTMPFIVMDTRGGILMNMH